MIDVTKTFMAEYPDKVIKAIGTYDANNFLVIAMDKGHDEEIGDPNFLVNKRNGSISQLNPLDDLVKFDSALRTLREVKQ